MVKTEMKTWCSHLIQKGNHIIGVFPNDQAKLDAAFEFLEDGLFRNETVMIVTDLMSEAKILKKMAKEWHVDAQSLVESNDIIVKSVSEIYFENGRPDPRKIKEQWNRLVTQLLAEGKSGLRVFEDTGPFFKHGFVKELVGYESILEQKFDLSLSVVCAYSYEDIDALSGKQFLTLKEHHGLVWA